MSKILEINNLEKQYGGIKVLNNLSLSLDKGKILGYLGPNGAGKTTTIKILLGLIKQSSGDTKIFGLDSQIDKVMIHERIAYVPSEPNYWPNLTAKEVLFLLSSVRQSYDREYEKELIVKFDFDPNKKIRQYSRGNKQKIGLISALATKADLLILDEPSTGLDPLMDQFFRESIRRAKDNGQTIFLSSHLLEEVESLCDEIAILKNGTLIESGELSKLQHLASVNIEATFSNKPPELNKFKHVVNYKVANNILTCQVNGDVNEVLEEILKHKPIRVYSRPTSLEDLFMSVYDNN